MTDLPRVRTWISFAVIVALSAGLGACWWWKAPSPWRLGGRIPELTSDPPVVPPPRQIAPGSTFVIAAAGDVAGRTNAQRLTARLLWRLRETRDLAAVLVLGDAQYPRGEYADFMTYYDASWGRPELKALTRPVPGNHEYDMGRSRADGYFDYFNGRGQDVGQAGARGQGYYSFDMGDWHFVALNTSDGCKLLGCGPNAPMHRWLVRDLAANRRKCVLAYMHHPRFQQGDYHGDNRRVAPLWDALYDAGVDVVLSGHEHNFQQLAPMDKRGALDPRNGIRSFVVGTGGAHPYREFSSKRTQLVEHSAAERYGVLELTLGPGTYAWRFLDASAPPTADVVTAGTDQCR